MRPYNWLKFFASGLKKCVFTILLYFVSEHNNPINHVSPNKKKCVVRSCYGLLKSRVGRKGILIFFSLYTSYSKCNVKWKFNMHFFVFTLVISIYLNQYIEKKPKNINSYCTHRIGLKIKYCLFAIADRPT